MKVAVNQGSILSPFFFVTLLDKGLKGKIGNAPNAILLDKLKTDLNVVATALEEK